MTSTTLLAVPALAAALALAPTAAASASATPTTSVPSAAAAGWLAGQLTGTNHDHYVFAGTAYADDGNTADGVLAMDAAGVAQAAAARATSWLESDAANYAGSSPNFYPGSLAKLLIVAEAQHVDGHHFGSLDLIADLKGEEDTSGTTKGLYDDPDPTYGYESVLTQALALVALSNTGNAADKPDQAAIDWLAGQQCPDGGWQNATRTDPSTDKCGSSEVDTTAFVAQAFIAVGDSTHATQALDWLSARRNSDGGYGLPTSNANSTAVTVQALVAGGRSATSGIAWLRSHQQGCTAPATQRAAISFQSKYDASTALRATTQGTQALAGKPLAAITATGASAAAPTLLCQIAPVPGEKPVHRPTSGHVPATVHASHERRTTGATLPVTGPAPVGPTALLAAGLIALGAGCSLLSRRRSS
jgi:hypothetical protein